jgi:trehalose 6-phosphate phosphatase
VERFFVRVACARNRVLLLDFDGTLAPFEARPDRVRPYPGLARLIDDIAARPRSRVVIVTGRRLDGLAPMLGLRHAVEMWGAHGWQRLVPGMPLTVYEPSARARELLALAQARAEPLRQWGARVERKPASVAVHWRGLHVLAREAIREALRRAWHGAARAPELEVLAFDGGIELRARGRNKGDVVNMVLDEAGTDGVGAYLGDDTTDEDAFAAIQGRGLGVLVRPVVRRTHAAAWLRPPRELAGFLHRWREIVAH